jgi:L-histidine N-alpha-methyltransferase
MGRALTPSRFRLVGHADQDRRAQFARDVAQGLTATPKRLPCCWFYDRRGSALFEAICELPEYYLTRAEREILEAHADEIAAAVPPEAMLIELGSGSAAKTTLLIEALLRRQPTLRYVPVDICHAALEESALRLLRRYPALSILAVAAEYREALQHLRAGGECPDIAESSEQLGTVPFFHADSPKLVLWLGSNIGNYHRDEAAGLLHEIGQSLKPCDRLLVGIDLRKDRAVLEAAYDDPQGVTAAFNRNLLERINRNLGGHFDPSAFRHRAHYDEALGRIEMHLVSQRPQRVAIDAVPLVARFAAGEAIHTENSYKYSLEEIAALAGASGLALCRQWFDAQRLFSLNLLEAAPSSSRSA